ncbi:MAG: apolipoprotein N-acyltransferase [Pseudomonadota bacterium]
MTVAVRSRGFTALGPMHHAFATLKGIPAGLVCALLGAVAALAFAPLHLSVSLLIGFVGLVWIIDGARSHKRWGRAAFYRGWAFGTGHFLVGLYWTAQPFLVEPEKHLAYIWMPVIALPAGMALITGAAVAAATVFWSSSPSRVFVFAAFFTLGELVRGTLFGGLPWNLAGTTWVPGGSLSQAASIGGAYWLTLITVFAMASPAALVDTREDRGLMVRLAPLLGAVIAFSGLWAWGGQRLATPPEMTGQGLVLLDSGVSQKDKWTVGAVEVFRQYEDMLAAIDETPGDLVILPEAAIPTTLLQTEGYVEALTERAGARKVIVGTARYQTYDKPEPTYYNSLAVLDRTSGRSGPLALYDKHRLVPFGELPAAKIVPFGEALSAFLPSAVQRLANSGYEAGPGPTILYVDGVAPFVAMICYEGLYPSIPRTATPRAEWMLVISNDGWFGEGFGPAQHAAQNRYRAIELGLPLVRVASRGQTGIVDGLGRLTVKAAPFPTQRDGWKPMIAEGVLPAALAPTPYQRFGPAFLWLSLVVCCVLAFATWRR